MLFTSPVEQQVCLVEVEGRGAGGEGNRMVAGCQGRSGLADLVSASACSACRHGLADLDITRRKVKQIIDHEAA